MADDLYTRLEAIAATADTAVRKAIADQVVSAIASGLTPPEAVQGTLAGAYSALAELAWRFRTPGTSPEQLCAALIQSSMSFFQQSAGSTDISGRLQ